MNSLRQRILIATFGTIVFFMLLAGVALDKAFQRVLRSNIAEQLQSLTFSLLASAELDHNGQFSIPAQLPQSDITIPGSGLVALIYDHNQGIVWRSPSSLGEQIPALTPISAGAINFQRNKGKPDLPFIFRLGSVWGSGDESDRFLTFAMVQSKTAYWRQIKDYRETLLQWLGGGGLLILLIHGYFLLRELRPLKRVVKEIDAIEQGKSDHIQGDYPTELALLTQRINRFIHSERDQLERYRHGLDDLAHSLKTPLAVIKGLESKQGLNADKTVQLSEQINRMAEIIDYQLKRASSVGINTLGAQKIALAPILQKIIASLDKVYADKNIQAQIHCDPTLTFLGDKDDLYEIAGNILDNAYKWADSKVEIHCAMISKNKQQWLNIIVQDDGPGFSSQSQAQITERGVRADEQVPGQGIGLAVVQSIVQNYQGTLHTSKSTLGGAMITLVFPL
ncbi:MAG: ATP-binding protein [Arenicellales bacterium]